MCGCMQILIAVWYPDHKNLCLVWDMEEIRSIGLRAEGDALSSEYDAGSEMDRREYNEVSGSEDANG